MSNLELHIDQLWARGRGDRAAVASVARCALPAALELVIPPVLAAAGLGPDAHVCVRRLSVRARAGGGERELAAAWAEAIAAALARALAAGAGAGGWTEDLAVFEDEHAAAWAALGARAEGVEPWWAKRHNSIDVVETDVTAMIQAGAVRAMCEITQLTARLGPRLLRALPVSLDPVRALLAARGAAGRLLAGPGWDEVDTAEALRSRMEELGSGLRLGGEALGAPGSVVENEPSGARPWGALTAAALDAASPPVRLLLLLALGWQEAPARTPTSALDLAAARWLASGGRVPSTPPTGIERDQGVTDVTFGSLPQALSARPAEARADPPAPSLPEAHTAATRAAGLLFLVRWCARDPLVLDTPTERLAQTLLDFGHLALSTSLAPVPAGARRLLIEPEWPLLAVFAGRDPSGRPPLPRDEPDAAALAALARLEAALPSELAVPGGSLELVSPDLEGALWTSPLALLLWRPGRLRWSAHSADLYLSMSLVDPALRAGGWDLDPGFVPWLGRVVRFQYHEDRE